MSATGNSFLIADSLAGELLPTHKERSQLAQQLCRGYLHAPTDGLILLEPSRRAEFRWDFFNADGSAAEMCGNAARCVGLYYTRKIKNVDHLTFETMAGAISWARRADGLLQVEMPELSWLAPVEQQFSINTGVPHIVLPTSPNQSVAKKFRALPAPGGSNVTFVETIDSSNCRALTYERGVEGFTAGCGTGAVAAAAFLYKQQTAKVGPAEFLVEMPGGQLRVEIFGSNQRPLLIGEASFDYQLQTK